MKRIIVSVTNDLTTDQRVHRVCSTLQQMNFEVLLIGRKLSTSRELHRKYKTIRFNLFFNNGFLFYAEFNLRLFFKLLFLKKSLLLSNDLDSLLPNYLVSRFSDVKLVYDSHELFTEVPELIDRPFIQNIWLRIESNILPKLKNNYTVCDSIASYYQKKYNTKFKVIRNLPYQIKINEKYTLPINCNEKKIILYQGAINKGRGLELIIDSMELVSNSILLIVGDGDILKDLKEKVFNLNLEKRVKFISKQKPKELKNLTPLADLGISIEEDLGLNYRFALPNKLFDYIQAKIPVLVSNLSEMKKIISNYNVGEVIIDRSPKALAQQINEILKKGKGHYSKHLEIARNELNWENESKKLIEIFKNLE